MRSIRAPRGARSRAREVFSFGGRIHTVVGALILTMAAASLFVAIASRHGFPAASVALTPARVFALEVWRLGTWSFVEESPFSLLFAVLFLYWFGGDLAVTWGPKRFLRVYLGLSLSVALVICVIGVLDPEVMASSYLGTLGFASGLVVAWGLLHPDREVRLYFLFPITGRFIVVLTVFLTIALGAYFGLEVVVPDLAAEALMALYVRMPPRSRKKKRRSPRQKRVPRVEIGRGGEIRLVDDD